MLPLMTLPSLIRTELLLSIRKTCYMDRPGIESCVAGNKTYASGVVCVVAEQGVCLQQRGGDFARAPWHVIPVKGLHQIHGHWGSSGPATRTPLGNAIFVPRRPGDRMGLCGPSRKHARHQHEWNVYRSCRSAVGRRRLYRAADSQAARKSQLFCKADRAREGYGSVCGCLGTRKPEALREFAFLALHHQPLIPFYTKSDDTLP